MGTDDHKKNQKKKRVFVLARNAKQGRVKGTEKNGAEAEWKRTNESKVY